MPGKDLLAEQLARLSRYFNKPFTPDQQAEYFDQLDNIPGFVLEQIATAMINDRRPTPGQFPTVNEIKKAWWIWQKENPNKVSREYEFQDCDRCGDRGLFWFKVKLDVGPREFPAICPHCNNWRRHLGNTEGIPLADRDQLELAGHWVWPYNPEKRPLAWDM